MNRRSLAPPFFYFHSRKTLSRISIAVIAIKFIFDVAVVATTKPLTQQQQQHLIQQQQQDQQQEQSTTTSSVDSLHRKSISNSISTCFRSYDTGEKIPLNDNCKLYQEVEGIQVPFTKSFPPTNIVAPNKIGTSSSMYYLNGAGLRSFSFFPFNEMKIYVASFYISPSSDDPFDHISPGSRIICNTTESIYNVIRMNQNNNSQQIHFLFEFIFLRNINENYVKKAWSYQLQHSIERDYTNYTNYDNDMAIFLSAFGSIDNKSDRTVSIQLLANGSSIIYDVGSFSMLENKPSHRLRKRVTAIHNSYEFQYAFCSMWFGQQPVTMELKENLLSTIGSGFYKKTSNRIPVDQQCNTNDSDAGNLQDNEYLVKVDGSQVVL